MIHEAVTMARFSIIMFGKGLNIQFEGGLAFTLPDPQDFHLHLLCALIFVQTWNLLFSWVHDSLSSSVVFDLPRMLMIR